MTSKLGKQSSPAIFEQKSRSPAAFDISSAMARNRHVTFATRANTCASMASSMEEVRVHTNNVTRIVTIAFWTPWCMAFVWKVLRSAALAAAAHASAAMTISAKPVGVNTFDVALAVAISFVGKVGNVLMQVFQVRCVRSFRDIASVVLI